MKHLFSSLLIAAHLSPLWADNVTPATPPELPSPVASFGATTDSQGQLFIYGGHAGVRHKYNKAEVSGTLHMWKPGASTWTELGNSEPAQGAALLTYAGRVLRVGGMAARNAKGEKQDLWSSDTAASFDLNENKWSPLPNLPARRSSHDALVLGDTLYVIGGWSLTGGGPHSATPEWHGTYLTLDLSKADAVWQSHPQPFKRRALAVHALGTKIYCIGGMNEGEDVTCDVEILDTATGEWSKGPSLPPDKLGGFGYSAISHEGRLFVSGLPGDLLELCGETWSSIAKMKHPRFFHRLVPGGPGKIIALGGENREGVKTPPEVIFVPAAPHDKAATATTTTR